MVSRATSCQGWGGVVRENWGVNVRELGAEILDEEIVEQTVEKGKVGTAEAPWREDHRHEEDEGEEDGDMGEGDERGRRKDME